MKCAFIASYYGPYYSNFVASLLSLHQEMVGRGHEMCYVFPAEAESFEWMPLLRKTNAAIHFIPYRGGKVKDLLLLKKIFKAEEIDLVYSRMCGWDFAARFAAPFTPLVWHMDMCVNLDTLARKIKNFVKFRILGFGKTYHLAVSNSVADIINSLHPRHRCLGIPNSLDTSRLPKAFVEPPHHSPCRFLMFGWAPVCKGLDTVLEACEILSAEGRKLELLVSSQEKTYKYIENRYGKNFPIWLKLVPPTNDVAGLYASADVMISSSRSEGFSYCLAEALYCGMPVIYSDIPGTSWADEFQAAYQFKMANVDDLCRAMQESMDTCITPEQQQANRDIVNQKYNIDAWTREIVDFLEAIPR